MFRGSRDSKPAKKSKANAGAGAEWMQQMGIEIPNFDADDNDDADIDEGDLLAELASFENGGERPRAKQPKAPPKKTGAPPAQSLQSFQNDVSQLMKDIDAPINDEDLSDGDEEELLAELQEITGGEMEVEQPPPKPVAQPSKTNNPLVSTLETRLGMYKKAVDTAKSKGEAPKARRFERQLNVIQEFLRDARAGKPVDESQIPPEIAVSAPQAQTDVQKMPTQASSPPPPARPPPVQPPTASLPPQEKPIVPERPAAPSSTGSKEDAIAHLTALAQQAARQGDREKAKEYLIQRKNLENGITASAAPSSLPPASSQQTIVNPASEEQAKEEEPLVPLVAPVPKTVMEALQQRHEEFAKRHKEALGKNEGSKARRLDRLTKQYQEAIDATRKGQPFDYSELPDLPGFAPIPVQQGKPQPTPAPSTAAAPAPARAPPSSVQARPSQPHTAPAASTAPKPRNEEQIRMLRLRHQQLLDLALQAKQKNNIESAKRHLISSKEVEKMLQAAEAGLPVDMTQVPEASTEDFDMVRDQELTEQIAQSDRGTIYRRLQDDLLLQIQLCARNQQIYAQMGGETNAKFAKDFKYLEQRCAHDLERLKQSFQHGLKPPAFHYEKRQMNIVPFNNDLTDNDCEVTVLRGINLQVPSGFTASALQTYIIIDFPYPPEASQTGRTRLATGAINAEYADGMHKFQIKRSDRKIHRLLERKEVKLTIFYKAGFLRADRQLGVASVKLAPLLQTATIHESVNVQETEQRKKFEGKLEVKIRIKEAIGVEKSSELISQVWLVIDRFESVTDNSKKSTATSIPTASPISTLSHLIPSTEALGFLAFNLAGNPPPNDSDQLATSSRASAAEPASDSRRHSQQSTLPQSIQVLKYEAENLQERIGQLEDVLSPDQIELLRSKHKELEQQKTRIIQNLRQGGKQAMEEHLRNLEQLLERYKREEEDYRQHNEAKKADLALNKKNLVAKEIETFTDPSDAPETTNF